MADLLSTVISSDKRRNVLLFLQENPKTLDEIKSALDVSATGMLPQLKILENEGLIIHSGRTYSLTTIGKTIVTHLEPFLQTVDVFDSQKKFWREHLLSELPEEILQDIRMLGKYRILETPDEEIFGIRTFLSNLDGAKELKGLSHTVHPEYPEYFMKLASNGTKLSLFFTPSVYRILLEKYQHLIKDYLDIDTVEAWVTKKDYKFSYAMTDKYFSISIFYANGVFDNKNDIISFDPSARMWGEKIHSYLLTQSEKIEPRR